MGAGWFIRDGMGDAVATGIEGVIVTGGCMMGCGFIGFSMGGLVLPLLGGLSRDMTFSSQGPRQLKRPPVFSTKHPLQRPLQQFLQKPIASTSRCEKHFILSP
jgi:hypothetical protein